MRKARRLPGEPAFWLLVWGDITIFTIFFLTFAWYRSEQLALFVQSQATLNRGLGLLNTLILLSSSLLVAIGVHRVRDRGAWGSNFFLGAALCGGAFVVIKVVEYGEKARAHLSLSNNDFYMLYFAFTGIHLTHVLIGILALLYIRKRAVELPLSPEATLVIECGAIFWHLVDLLWIILFALLYVIR